MRKERPGDGFHLAGGARLIVEYNQGRPVGGNGIDDAHQAGQIARGEGRQVHRRDPEDAGHADGHQQRRGDHPAQDARPGLGGRPRPHLALFLFDQAMEQLGLGVLSLVDVETGRLPGRRVRHCHHRLSQQDAAQARQRSRQLNRLVLGTLDLDDRAERVDRPHRFQPGRQRRRGQIGTIGQFGWTPLADPIRHLRRDGRQVDVRGGLGRRTFAIENQGRDARELTAAVVGDAHEP